MPSFGGGQPSVRGGDSPGTDPLVADSGDDLAGVGAGTGPSSLPLLGTNGADSAPGNGNGSSDPGAVSMPPAAAQDQRLPIFDSLESDWFRRSGKTLSSAARTAQPAAAGAQTQAASTWTSPADEGWRAAQVVAAPAAGETTTAGLPKRVPRANLVPGSVGGGGQDAEGSASAAPARTADDVRARLSSYQRGVREGRAAAPQIEEQ
jgi:hypothetical protein